MFIIPSFPYSIITEEPVKIYITCGLGNQFSGLHVKITSKDLAARQSIPVKKFFE